MYRTLTGNIVVTWNTSKYRILYSAIVSRNASTKTLETPHHVCIQHWKFCCYIYVINTYIRYSATASSQTVPQLQQNGTTACDGIQERLYYNTGNPTSCMYTALEILSLHVLHQNRYWIFADGKQLDCASTINATKQHHRIIHNWYNTENTTSYMMENLHRALYKVPFGDNLSPLVP